MGFDKDKRPSVTPGLAEFVQTATTQATALLNRGISLCSRKSSVGTSTQLYTLNAPTRAGLEKLILIAGANAATSSRSVRVTAAGIIDSPAAPRDGVGHVNWLREAAKEFPVILIKPRPDQPDALILPKAEIMAYFGSNYFTNSVSWMLGLAIMQLVPNGAGTRCVDGAELGVFGVDMMVAGGQGSGYGWQRPYS